MKSIDFKCSSISCTCALQRIGLSKSNIASGPVGSHRNPSPNIDLVLDREKCTEILVRVEFSLAVMITLPNILHSRDSNFGEFVVCHYPLVNVYIAMENHYFIAGSIHELNGDFQ